MKWLVTANCELRTKKSHQEWLRKGTHLCATPAALGHIQRYSKMLEALTLLAINLRTLCIVFNNYHYSKQMFGISAQRLYWHNSGAAHSRVCAVLEEFSALKHPVLTVGHWIIFSVNSHEVAVLLCFCFNLAGAEWEIQPILLIQRKVKFYIYVMFKLSVLRL